MFRIWGPGIARCFSSAAFMLAVCVLSACQGRGVENAPEAEPRPSASLPEPAAPEPAPAPAVPGPAPAQEPVPAPPAAIVPLTPGGKTEDERNSISVFEAVAPATVFVTNKRTLVDPFRRAVDVPTGTGSGFLWDNKGHVVTNHHVVQGAQALSVTLHDHRTFDATVVGSDPRKDIAVLAMK